MKLICLGNCATQTSLYETTSFLIEEAETKTLIDAGPGVIRQLYRARESAASITCVVITHCHGDHTLGFPYFLFSNFVERTQGKKGPTRIPVIALPEVYDGLMAMFKFTYPPGQYQSFSTENLKASKSGKSEFSVGVTSIATYPVKHVVPNLGIRIRLGNVEIAYSSDTVFDEGFVSFAKGCKVLIHEAFSTNAMKGMATQFGHSVAEDAGKAATEVGAQTLVLCHTFQELMDKRERLVEEAGKHFEGKIIAPAELEVMEF